MPEDTFRILLAPGARRALTDTLPSAAAFAAWGFISGPLAERPRTVGASLKAPFDGRWRARRGEYQVRYRIDETKHVVLVLDVDHRHRQQLAGLDGIGFGAELSEVRPSDAEQLPQSTADVANDRP